MSNYWLISPVKKSKQLAFQAVLLYCVVAGLWIIFSDRILASQVSDIVLLNRMQTLKDLVFISVSSVVFYFILASRLQLWDQEKIERKIAEKQLEDHARMLDLASDTIFIRDHQDRIVYWNKGAERLYGWSKEEVIGHVTHDLFQTRFILGGMVRG